MTQKILKVSEVSEQYNLSISSIYRLSAKGNFPKIFKLGKRSSGVLKSEVEQWLEERIKASRNGEV